MFMNMKKTSLALAVTAAFTVVAMPSHATIGGVPGEALLIPFAAQDYGEATGVPINDSENVYTSVIITTPSSVGTDTVLNGYTLPNILDGNEEYNFPAQEAVTVRWTAFDDKSKEIADGTFMMSADDVYLWSPQDANLREYIGYVVFSDDKAKTGEYAATFAMGGNGFMLMEDSCEALGDPDTGLCSSTADDTNFTLPVVPMSDGIDYCMQRGMIPPIPQPATPGTKDNIACSTDSGNAHLAITYMNNVVAERDYSVVNGNGVGHVSPLVAGVRLQAPFTGAADGTGGTFKYSLVNGLFSHYDGNWTHVFWFSDNDSSRVVDPEAIDDDQTRQSCVDIPMPNELHGFVYADDENRIYDLVQGFRLETDNVGSTEFEDACLTDGTPNNCRAICGTGGTGFFGWPDNGFTQAAPGIGIMEYFVPAGPFDTSTGVFFQLMSNINWSGDYNDRDIAMGNNFDVYAGGYQMMLERGKFGKN
jgi:hypothetical protein